MSRTFAIGDIHGCLTALDTLLNVLSPAEDDQLIFLGDYVDRGPDSRGVIERMIELSRRPKFVALCGNHDVWMVRAAQEESWFRSWIRNGVGGMQTLQSYSGDFKDVPESHWEFLVHTCRNYYQTRTEIFVHGAVAANVTVDAQTEEWLLWERVYNQQPHQSGKRVICGHTSQKNGVPYNIGHAVCIDTFCHGGGWLTALDVEANTYIQTNQMGLIRRGFLED
jgi:serine/threonine protein phosphatase 1